MDFVWISDPQSKSNFCVNFIKNTSTHSVFWSCDFMLQSHFKHVTHDEKETWFYEGSKFQDAIKIMLATSMYKILDQLV